MKYLTRKAGTTVRGSAGGGSWHFPGGERTGSATIAF
jgi:hypothetical protein